jgi:hypothetical protein
MLSSINDFIAILIFGALVVLAFLLIANPLKVNKAANRYFGLFLLLWATFWTEEILDMIGFPLANSEFWLALEFIQFFTPIIFYISVRFFTNPFRGFSRRDIKYFLLPVIYLLVLILLQREEPINDLRIAQVLLIIGQALFFSFLSFQKIRLHSKRIELFRSNKQEVDLNWIQQIIIALVALK